MILIRIYEQLHCFSLLLINKLIHICIFSWFYLTLFNSSGRFGHTRFHFQHCLLYCKVSIFPTAPFSPQLHFPHSCEEMVFELKEIGLANLIRYSDLCYPQQKLVASPGYWTPVSWVWSQDSTTELSCLCWKWGAKLLNIYYTNIFWDILATNKKQQIK